MHVYFKLHFEIIRYMNLFLMFTSPDKEQIVTYSAHCVFIETCCTDKSYYYHSAVFVEVFIKYIKICHSHNDIYHFLKIMTQISGSWYILYCIFTETLFNENIYATIKYDASYFIRSF